MNIAIFGVTGMIGQRILAEALARGHQVTALVRDLDATATPAANPKKVQASIFDPASISRAAAGQDVLISAYGPGKDDPRKIVQATRSLIEGVSNWPSLRLITIGGSGSLEVAPGLQLSDSPAFPPAWKDLAQAHYDALEVLRNCKINWTSLAPSAFIEPGERTGHYRTGTDHLVTDQNGNSRISAEDYAVAMLDEIERPKFIGKRFTAGY